MLIKVDQCFIGIWKYDVDSLKLMDKTVGAGEFAKA